MRSITAYLLALAFVAGARTTHAACFYPNTSISGYRAGLKDEIKATPLIIVGKIVGQQYIQGDPTDPDAITAYIYKIQVLRLLKGVAPRTVYVQAENDSGGYRMNFGEQDLLFLRKIGRLFEADACGNSARFPEGTAVAQKVEALLTSRPAAVAR